MQARDVMSGKIQMIPSNTSIQAAAELMRQMDVGMLPVSEDGKIIGMLSDRDITVRAVAEGADPAATPAREIMSRDVIACFADQDARDVARLMQQNRVRRVIVINRENEAVGLVSVDDLVMYPETRSLVDEVVRQFAQH
jgi:CBS domain-containing protein